MHPIVTRLLIRALLWLTVVLLAGAAVLVAVVSAHAATVGSWNKPGENPFKGSRWHAVMSYKDMPLHHRIILGLRVQWDAPDVLMKITKRSVWAEGHTFTTDITGMHFGKGGRYETIDRSQWAEDHVEYARGWCYEESCIGSPYVCNNIFAIWREFNAATIKRDAIARGEVFRDEAAHVSEPAFVWVLMIGVCLGSSVCVRPEARREPDMLFEHLICGPIQTGKTTIAIGALEKNHAEGRAAAYIVPTRELAALASRRTKVQCLAIEDALACQEPAWSVVAVDDVERMTPGAVFDLRKKLNVRGKHVVMIVVAMKFPSNPAAEAEFLSEGDPAALA